jgi:hypothetical protein
MNYVTEATKIQITLVIAIMGGVVWLTNIHAKASNAEEKLDRLEQAIVDIAEMRKDIEYIKKSLEK